ncbi:thiamine pyrophosphate-dependent enzyme [Nostoc sp.]|uniref:thiamine pyrophosphate-dependent enzyme n=1 Tax=Nostoc sp. TaxID=1180 RepID=UPI002FF4AB37
MNVIQPLSNIKKSGKPKLRTPSSVTSKKITQFQDLFDSSASLSSPSLLRYPPLIDFPSTTTSDVIPLNSQQLTANVSVVSTVVKILEDLGVKYAFGVSGGAIAPLWAGLENSSIKVIHFRHEAGAAFAVVEAYFASGSPIVVFGTTGPGISNALTGLLAARWEGAKVIFLSGSTSCAQRGRWALQETSAHTMPSAGIFTSGSLFDYATVVESGTQLPEISRKLASGLSRPKGFVAHLSLPIDVQTSFLKESLPKINLSHAPVTTNEETITKCVKLLSEGPFAIWVGFGSRKAAGIIRELAKRTGVAVMSSPRGKGIFPEDHPQFVGVTGFGGHNSVLQYMQENCPSRILVLGSRLSERTSSWNPIMIPSRGFIHVDIDPEVAGAAYPFAETFAVEADIELFVKALLKHFPKCSTPVQTKEFPRPSYYLPEIEDNHLVRPQVLFSIIQKVIVQASNTLVMAESGNSLAWATHLLKFNRPEQYRSGSGFGSMGHFVTGVVGAALAQNTKVVAIVGDGAMLMNNEVSTAVKYQAPAVWIVLNDARYNMCKQGMALLGFKNIDAEIPSVDFVMLARSMGADGIRVERESDIPAALEKALAATGPFVVDVAIDPNQAAPVGCRVQNLMSQSAN